MNFFFYIKKKKRLDFIKYLSSSMTMSFVTFLLFMQLNQAKIIELEKQNKKTRHTNAG